MKCLALATALALTASPLKAHEDHRQLGTHEHGVGYVGVAIDGNQIGIDLRVPGSDIVGFEHAPQNENDRARVSDAIILLEEPFALFSFPDAAHCTLDHAQAEYGASATEHGHGDHEDNHDHHHDLHAEFHASYRLTCTTLQALKKIRFPYFDRFQAARALEVQLVSDVAANQSRVTREAPVLDLRSGM